MNIDHQSVKRGFVKLNHVNKIYPNSYQAVYDFNLEINQHEFIALVGPSGCGKSTTLRMIAGLEEITNGDLVIDEKYSNFVQSKDRDIAMVFQSYALYPHLNVYDNISFGLKTLKMSKSEIEQRVFEAARILDLGQYLDRFPKELSGGQMQRVALGRAIVRHARIFLMDEPLSNLDAKLRMQMRSEIVRIHEKVQATTIYVTHDQTEAMTMADRLVVMNKGFIQQVGEPMEIYDNPSNLFVATFIGAPAMNIVDAIYQDNKIILEDGLTLDLPQDFKRQYINFYQDKINHYQSLLEKQDLDFRELEAYWQSTKSSLGVDKNQLLVHRQKANFITNIQSLFKKKKKNVLHEKEVEVRDYIRTLISQFEKARDGQQVVKVGIRPEDIYLASTTVEGRMSDMFTLKPSLVETLGSEYILHALWNNTDLTIKIGTKHPIKNRSTLDFVINVDRIHIFDSISGLAIR